MLHVTENSIYQTRQGLEKDWGIPELLETYNPLPEEPLRERNAAIQQIMPLAAEQYAELSETARLRFDFWKNLVPAHIAEQRYAYETKVYFTYKWELTLNSEGLFYKDLSPEYSQGIGKVYEQLFSDFWFYGPLLPIPDLDIRRRVLAQIRYAFSQPDHPVAQHHFELFEYPPLPNTGMFWESGDGYSTDFTYVRTHGIETGCSNFRDGLMYVTYTSFERFLTQPSVEEGYLTPDVRAAIEEHLNRKATRKKVEDTPDANAAAKRLFMENGGNTDAIRQDGFMDEYHPAPTEEAAWRKELIEQQTQRLREESNEAVLGSIIKTLQYNGVEHLEDLLLDVAKTSNPKARQTLAKFLTDQFDLEKGAEALLALLEYDTQDTYWRNYVFNSCFRLPKSRTIRRWIAHCLQGDSEVYFKKAVDVLQMWGMMGNGTLANPALLKQLSWEAKTAGGAGFHESLDKILAVIGD